jgi:hypothetical protein
MMANEPAPHRRETDFKFETIIKELVELKAMISQLFDRQRDSDIKQGRHDERLNSIEHKTHCVDSEQKKLFWWMLGTMGAAIVSIALRFLP